MSDRERFYADGRRVMLNFAGDGLYRATAATPEDAMAIAQLLNDEIDRADKAEAALSEAVEHAHESLERLGDVEAERDRLRLLVHADISAQADAISALQDENEALRAALDRAEKAEAERDEARRQLYEGAPNDA